MTDIIWGKFGLKIDTHSGGRCEEPQEELPEDRLRVSLPSHPQKEAALLTSSGLQGCETILSVA
jgi:hypothetical protein